MFIAAYFAMWYYLRQIVDLSLREAFAGPVAAATLTLLVYAIFSLIVDLNMLPLLARLLIKAGVVGGVFALVLYALQPKQCVERTRYVWRLLRRRAPDLAEFDETPASGASESR